MNFRRAAKLLGAAAGLVLAQFLLFGKFLADLAPPVPDVDTKVGLASMISLIVLLIVTLWGKDKVGERYNNTAMVFAGAFLIGAVILYFYYDRLEGGYVYRYPPSETQTVDSDRYIRGDLHEQGKRRVGSRSISAAIFDLGGPDYVVAEQLLWTEESQRGAARQLLACYLAIVVTLGLALYLLLVRLVDGTPVKKKKPG